MTLQHLRGRRLLLQRFRQLPRADVDFVLQIGVGFLQPAGHFVELIGECLDFVAGLDGDALAERSPPPRRAAPARSAWIGTTMRRRGTIRRQRRAPARRGALAGAFDRRIKRRIGL